MTLGPLVPRHPRKVEASVEVSRSRVRFMFFPSKGHVESAHLKSCSGTLSSPPPLESLANHLPGFQGLDLLLGITQFRQHFLAMGSQGYAGIAGSTGSGGKLDGATQLTLGLSVLIRHLHHHLPRLQLGVFGG